MDKTNPPTLLTPSRQPESPDNSGYARAARCVLNQYYRACGLPNQGWPRDHAGWGLLLSWMVNDLRFRIRPSTWRLYRNAIRRYAPEERGFLHQLASPPARGTGQQINTGAKRQKGLESKDLSKIRHWLNQHAPRWGGTAALWLEAGALTGLRPSEWKQCTLITHEGCPFLRVLTLKQEAGNKRLMTQSKSNYRHIPLEHLSDFDLQTIRKQILIVKRVLKHHIWDQYQRGCQNAISRANRELFPNRNKTIALYSSRHEFAAQLKTLLTEETSGRIMGQATSNTFKRRYGGRRKTNNRPIPFQAEYRLIDTLNCLETEDE